MMRWKATGIGTIAGLAAAVRLVAAGAETSLTKMDFAEKSIGAPPPDFEFAITGEGELGQWTVVRDPTAGDGRVALWTQEDNVTRFDRIAIQALPDTEYR